MELKRMQSFEKVSSEANDEQGGASAFSDLWCLFIVLSLCIQFRKEAHKFILD